MDDTEKALHEAREASLNRMCQSSLESHKGTGLVWLPGYPMLGQEYFEHCKTLANRTILLDHLPKNGIVTEVGVRQGKFSQQILNRCTPKRLHLIDRHLGRLEGVYRSFCNLGKVS